MGLKMKCPLMWTFAASFILLSCVNYSSSLAVISVDLGSEWMKVAIVSPGVPMEIVLNKESKRKTPAVLSFRGEDRTFGEDAITASARFPKQTYAYLLDLVGKKIDNPLVKQFQRRFPFYDIISDPIRGTVLFKHDDGVNYSPEELLGMLLHRAKEFAEASAGQAVNEMVLIVPGYFNQAERQAMLQAADLAGFKVLQLMNDYTAVALNYGIYRRKDFNETAQYVMFYDMGASSTTATIVSYQVVKTKERGFVESHPQASIIGVGYDRSLGGLEIQLRLRDYLAQKFNDLKKTPNDVFKNPRALAKLFKEAGRVKNVLSANADHFAQVEGLLDDIDLKIQVTREQLEDLCKDLFDRIRGPVDQALKTSGLSMDVISQVVLVGAGARMPKVQERLQEVVKMDLAKNINADEAAAMGAVYKAADLSTGFKVKPFLTKDAVVLPIQVTFEREIEGSAPKQIKRLLFGPMNPYPQKKVLTFNKHTDDFSFNVKYADLDHIPENEVQNIGSLDLRTVSLSGVSEALNKHKGPNAESKGIKAHFSMDESGILSLLNVELLVEKNSTDDEESTFSKLGSTISKLFTNPDEAESEKTGEKPIHEEPEEGGEEKDVKDSKDKEKKDEKPDESKTQEAKPDEKTDDSKKEDAKKEESEKKGEKKTLTKLLKEKISTEEEQLGVIPMNKDALQEAFRKIQTLNEYDFQRNRRESALNALESYVFDAQNKLEEDDFQSAATTEEIEKIRLGCSEVSDWLYEDGATADAEAYEAKLQDLQKLTKPLYLRVAEHRERPEAIAALRQVLNGSSIFLKDARNVTAAKLEAEESWVFTEIELNTLEKQIKETEEWLIKMEKEQAEQKRSEAPKMSIKSISEKITNLDREVKYLVNKAKIWRPPKAKEDINNDAKNSTEKKKETKGSKDSSADESTVETEESKDQSEKTASNEESEKIPKPEEESESPEKGVPDSSKTGESSDVPHSEL
ncbi:Hypoxia up-regulated protein 1 [Frankliniella fusca]|uniref:Hypoxia up-regulated protein 1 n=1 Tax=Frankliniella fusca TaxID=407009 RepID=A0AAE1H1A1_9NEOP|nr:Hypoxia up-regulated protein 1 [Frankliniella fusca]